MAHEDKTYKSIYRVPFIEFHFCYVCVLLLVLPLVNYMSNYIQKIIAIHYFIQYNKFQT